MDRQTIPGEYAVRADLVGGTGWVIGNSSQLHIEAIRDLIRQSLDAFSKLLPVVLSDRRQTTYLLSRFDQQNKTTVNSRQTMARQDLHRTTHQRPLSANQVEPVRDITIAIFSPPDSQRHSSTGFLSTFATFTPESC